MSAEKSSMERQGPGIAGALAGKERDEGGRIPQIWTVEKALDKSKGFSTRKDFRKSEPSAYSYLVRKKSAHLLHFEKEVKRHRVSDFDVICAIKSCSTRKEMHDRFPGEHSAANKRSHIKSIYNDHFGRGKTSRYWNKRKVLECARRFETRSDFCVNESGAYEYAYNNGFIDEACAHMERKKSEYNVAYFWIAQQENQSENHLVKVGVTSKRLGLARIYQVARKHELSPEKIFIIESGDALSIESEMKKIGSAAGFSGTDGSSEFYYMSDNELESIKRMRRWQSKGPMNGFARD